MKQSLGLTYCVPRIIIPFMKVVREKHMWTKVSRWFLAGLILALGSQVSICTVLCHSEVMHSLARDADAAMHAAPCCRQYAGNMATAKTDNEGDTCHTCEKASGLQLFQSTTLVNFQLRLDGGALLQDIYCRVPILDDHFKHKRLAQQRPPLKTPPFLILETLLI